MHSVIELQKPSLTFAQWIKLFVIGALSTLYRAYIPSLPLYGMVHDDQLQVSLANNILNGDWLGPYGELTHRTLAKGPGYPIFLAKTHFLPWSPVVSVHVLLLSSALFCLILLFKLGMHTSFLTPSFAFVAFFPAWFGDSMSRIYRDGLLTALTFLVMSAVLTLVHSFDRYQLREFGLRQFIIRVFAAGIAFGISLSWWYLTKNTILPLVGSALVVVFFLAFKHRSAQRIMLLFAFVIASFAAFFPSVMFVKNQNDKHYGVSVVDNFYSGYFAKTLSLITSVEPVSKIRYVAVTKYQRQNLYASSPTFRMLRPWLEAKPGEGWRGQSCASPMKICDESAGWFPWELRDAAEYAGLGKSALDFEATFQRVHHEVTSACRTGQLICGNPALISGIPLLNNVPIRDYLESPFIGFTSIWNIESWRKGPPPYFESIDSATQGIWTKAVKSLPINSPNPVYKPSINNGIYSLSLIFGLYEIIWHLLIAFSLIAAAYCLYNWKHLHSSLMITAVASTFSVVIFVFSLSILEAAGGPYLTGSADSYLLPVYPTVLLSIIALTASLHKILETKLQNILLRIKS